MGFDTENLKRALTSSDAAALIPYDLENQLDEELIRLQPLLEIIPVLQAEGKTHEYQIRTAHPQGWFEGETTPANPKKGTYVRKSVQLKISRIWGQVTGFSQAVTERFISALATEMEGSVQGMADLLEYGILFGCADDINFTGDAYQYSGIIPRILSFAPGNVIDAGGDKVSLTDLDSVLALVRQHRQTVRDPGLWFMGISMKQVVDGLQSKVQLPLQTVQYADGKIEMAGYGRAGILETNYMVPGTSSPTVSASPATGGSLPDGNYTHRMSSVTIYGECIGGTAGSEQTCGTGNNTIDLTWTADSAAVLYMVWRKAASGDFQLIDIIPALTYDSDGTVNGAVESYSDDGSLTAKAVKPLETGEEQILYINTNPNRGMAWMGMIDDMGSPINNLTSYVELARVKDTYDYMLKCYLTARMKYPNVFSLIRHAKKA